ncbi:MAG: glycoside hydrolase family 3 protein, partial [Bdellovibrionales bacterium]|nr:glycoside hydrolase family 3 protein [Bdellovibrionales bacterium]
MISIQKFNQLDFLFCIKKLLLVFWARSLILFLHLLFFSPMSFADSYSLESELYKNNESKITQIVQSLSVEQKVGQLFIFGFTGQTMTPHLTTLLSNYSPGAVIVFKRNIKDLSSISTLNRDMQILSLKKSKIPLFIMVDQEGGNVSRLILHPRPPSAHSLGQSNNLTFAKYYGQLTGELLYLTGFNFNLAPVVDLSNPNVKNFIGSRSFGNDPHKVYRLASEFSKGLLDYSVLPTFKHFPGHGNLKGDSHKITPIKSLSLNELLKLDLIPFSELAKDKIPAAIMTSHISFPKIDKSKLPATYSKVILTELLRQRLMYDGLIITDDLQMAGAKQVGSIGKRAIKAINAGSDMIMVAWSLKKQILAYKAVLDAVKKGEITEDRLNQSLYRILRIKMAQDRIKNFSSNALMARISKVQNEIKNLGQKIARLNLQSKFQTISNKIKISPSQKLHVFSADKGLFKLVQSHFRNSSQFHHLKRNTKIDVAKILYTDNSAIGVFYVSGEGTARILNDLPLQIKKRVIVINSSYPGIINQAKFFGTFQNEG